MKSRPHEAPLLPEHLHHTEAEWYPEQALNYFQTHEFWNFSGCEGGLHVTRNEHHLLWNIERWLTPAVLGADPQTSILTKSDKKKA